MRSPTSLHESRVYSQKKFLSRVQKDFCNKIGTKLPRASESECPQLAKADVRALTMGSGLTLSGQLASKFAVMHNRLHCVVGWGRPPREG